MTKGYVMVATLDYAIRSVQRAGRLPAPSTTPAPRATAAATFTGTGCFRPTFASRLKVLPLEIGQPQQHLLLELVVDFGVGGVSVTVPVQVEQ